MGEDHWKYLLTNGEQLIFHEQQEAIFYYLNYIFFHLRFLPFCPMVLVTFKSMAISLTSTCMTEWAERLLWYDDDRFAKHPYFKFAVHSVIMRKMPWKRAFT